MHVSRRARVDVKHTTGGWPVAVTRGARLCVQGDRGSRRRLKDDAPGDFEPAPGAAEGAVEDVGAVAKDNAGDGCVGECSA